MSSHRFSVSFDDATFEQIQLISKKESISYAEVIRELVTDSLNGEITRNNIDFISRIMREQIKDVLQPGIERLAAIGAKSGVQSATAAYLTAETIARFLPVELQEDVQDVYIQARKKAVQYMQRKTDSFDELE